MNGRKGFCFVFLDRKSTSQTTPLTAIYQTSTVKFNTNNTANKPSLKRQNPIKVATESEPGFFGHLIEPRDIAAGLPTDSLRFALYFLEINATLPITGVQNSRLVSAFVSELGDRRGRDSTANTRAAEKVHYKSHYFEIFMSDG